MQADGTGRAGLVEGIYRERDGSASAEALSTDRVGERQEKIKKRKNGRQRWLPAVSVF